MNKDGQKKEKTENKLININSSIPTSNTKINNNKNNINNNDKNKSKNINNNNARMNNSMNNSYMFPSQYMGMNFIHICSNKKYR